MCARGFGRAVIVHTNCIECTHTHAPQPHKYWMHENWISEWINVCLGLAMRPLIRRSTRNSRNPSNYDNVIRNDNAGIMPRVSSSMLSSWSSVSIVPLCQRCQRTIDRYIYIECSRTVQWHATAHTHAGAHRNHYIVIWSLLSSI